MSPYRLCSRRAAPRFPRVSGDEPATGFRLTFPDRFSPREWG